MDRAKLSLYLTIKTICDYSLSILFLIFLTPLALILSLLIFITGGRPVIYSQKRTGINGKEFMIHKFRSLKHGVYEGTNLVTDRNDMRITRVGRIMRKFRLDEIPNFINVIKGDMSFVGPRPEQPYYIEKIVMKAPQYRELLKIKPGVTSWGEVKYGYASSVEQMIERLEFDLYYLKKRSIWFDLKIILHTVRVVINGRGI